MKKKKKSSTNKHSEKSSKMNADDNPDKRNPNPNEPFEETGTPVEKVPITSSPDHPHQEEILDDIPK